MGGAEERDYLERVIAGKAQPNLGPAATAGRLAELYLQEPAKPGFAGRAVALAEAGLELEAPDSPLYPKLRHFQAMALRALEKPPDGALGIRGTAAEADREAWKLLLALSPQEAMLCAAAWADWAWERNAFDESAEAYSKAHRALRQLVLRHVADEAERLKLLANRGLATRGAYALYKTGEYQKAILLLENTAVYGLNANQQAGELRTLAAANPLLRERLLAAMASQNAIHGRLGVDALGRISKEEAQAIAEIDAILEEVRRIPGFESFAKPPTWNDVVEASSRMPLVYVVPTGKGSVALAVFPGENRDRQLLTVEIPTRSDEIRDAMRPFVRAEYASDGDRFDALSAMLEWLGNRVMMYVRWMLLEQTGKEGPFALIPFGPLSTLPVHAGFIRTEEGHINVLFHPRHVTFAYSARGLAAAYCNSVRENPSPRALVVSNPRPVPPTYDSLLLSDFEARIVAGHCAADVVAGRVATTERVTGLLPAAAVAHFSCHGSVDARFSYSGVLFLADTQVLTYEHLRRVPELAAKLVVLSACRSGSASIFIEHALNLPNAFLAAGAAAVLGTFWRTDEAASLLLLTRFYEIWLERKCPAVEALGDAQAWLLSAPAEALRQRLPAGALESPAVERLRKADASEPVYAHPWYWAGFFVAGV